MNQRLQFQIPLYFSCGNWTSAFTETSKPNTLFLRKVSIIFVSWIVDGCPSGARLMLDATPVSARIKQFVAKGTIHYLPCESFASETHIVEFLTKGCIRTTKSWPQREDTPLNCQRVRKTVMKLQNQTPTTILWRKMLRISCKDSALALINRKATWNLLQTKLFTYQRPWRINYWPRFELSYRIKFWPKLRNP